MQALFMYFGVSFMSLLKAICWDCMTLSGLQIRCHYSFSSQMRERPLCSEVPSNNHHQRCDIQLIFPVLEVLFGSNFMLEIQAIKRNFVCEVQNIVSLHQFVHIQSNEWKGIICHLQMDISKTYFSGPPCCVAPSFYTKSKKSCEAIKTNLNVFSKYEVRCLGFGSAQ